MRRIMRILTLFFCFSTFLNLSPMQAQKPYGDQPLAHTYSIVAFDSLTGDMGVAVQSHWFSVGPLVAWGEAGVGVVATQSFVNPDFGPEGLALLKAGHSPQEAIELLLGKDESRAVRQLAILNAKGVAAAHTGSKCIPMAGHHVGDDFSVQANLMLTDKVWGAMAAIFRQTRGLPLAERMVAALEAAEAVGGDIRGKQSAALLVVSGQPTGKVWKDRKVDLRVEDHQQPVQEIKRLLRVHRAYEFMNEGDIHMEKGNIDEAMKAYHTASHHFPDNQEMKFWTAVSLVNSGQIDKALPIFERVFNADHHWRMLVPRLKEVDLLEVSDEVLERILR